MSLNRDCIKYLYFKNVDQALGKLKFGSGKTRSFVAGTPIWLLFLSSHLHPLRLFFHLFNDTDAGAIVPVAPGNEQNSDIKLSKNGRV